MKRKPLFIGLTIFLVIGSVLLLTTINHREPDVNLVMSPSVATAKMDGSKNVGSGKFYATPGKHTIVASFKGFADNSATFTAQKGKITTLTVLLLPNSQEGQQWLLDHPREQTNREGIVGKAFGESNQQRATANPIIGILPHVDNLFSVEYGVSKLHPNDDSAIAIYISYYSANGLQQALDWLKFKGYDPNSLELIYTDKTADGFN